MAAATATSATARLTRLAEVLVAFLFAILFSLSFGGLVVGFMGTANTSLVPFLVTYVIGYGVLGAAAVVYIRVFQNTNAIDLSLPSLHDVRDVLVGFIVVVVFVPPRR
jgi:hypothetical protein